MYYLSVNLYLLSFLLILSWLCILSDIWSRLCSNSYHLHKGPQNVVDFFIKLFLYHCPLKGLFLLILDGKSLGKFLTVYFVCPQRERRACWWDRSLCLSWGSSYLFTLYTMITGTNFLKRTVSLENNSVLSVYLGQNLEGVLSVLIWACTYICT